MTKLTAAVAESKLPELDAVIGCETTDDGWRGLTAHGEVLTVRSRKAGERPKPPDDLLVVRDNLPVGRRIVRDNVLDITRYLDHYDRGIELFRSNQCAAALAELDAAIAIAPTARANFNRGLVLLTMGRWREGFAPYEDRLKLFMPPLCQAAIAQGIPQWHGEPLCGRRLLLVHDAGFGDTIQMLRYVPTLRQRGADVALFMPPELRRFAAQAAPLAAPLQAFDYFCPMLSLLHLLDQTITTVPGEPYLKPDPALLQRWRDRLGKKTRPRIGIAWSVGREIAGDYPRNVPLQLLNQGVDDADVFSLQMQGADEALAHCVKVYTFEDFADCAALMSQMDRIITVDTAAVHLAGAIGHPNVTLLLSHWASWRWCGNPFYPGIQICQQTAPGDWHSALSQLT